jgi:hypothetical protein
MSDLPLDRLASPDAEIRRQACEAIADACEAGVPIDAALEPVAKLLSDADTGVRAMAIFVLAMATERGLDVPAPALVGALGDEDDDIRHNARHAITQMLDKAATRMALLQGLADERPRVRQTAAQVLATRCAGDGDSAQLAALVRHADQQARMGAVNALAEGALPAGPAVEVVAALADAIGDGDTRIKKDAIWALYLFASEGKDIQPAVAALEGALADPTLQGNAAIALAATGRFADALIARPEGPVQLGAGWGAGDYAMRQNDAPALKKLFTHENVNVRRGLGGSLHHAKEHGRDISLAGNVFKELLAEHADDNVMQAQLYGVVQIVDRGP